MANVASRIKESFQKFNDKLKKKVERLVDTPKKRAKFVEKTVRRFEAEYVYNKDPDKNLIGYEAWQKLDKCTKEDGWTSPRMRYREEIRVEVNRVSEMVDESILWERIARAVLTFVLTGAAGAVVAGIVAATEGGATPLVIAMPFVAAAISSTVSVLTSDISRRYRIKGGTRTVNWKQRESLEKLKELAKEQQKELAEAKAIEAKNKEKEKAIEEAKASGTKEKEKETVKEKTFTPVLTTKENLPLPKADVKPTAKILPFEAPKKQTTLSDHEKRLSDKAFSTWMHRKDIRHHTRRRDIGLHTGPLTTETPKNAPLIEQFFHHKNDHQNGKPAQYGGVGARITGGRVVALSEDHARLQGENALKENDRISAVYVSVKERYTLSRTSAKDVTVTADGKIQLEHLQDELVEVIMKTVGRGVPKTTLKMDVEREGKKISLRLTRYPQQYAEAHQLFKSFGTPSKVQYPDKGLINLQKNLAEIHRMPPFRSVG